MTVCLLPTFLWSPGSFLGLVAFAIACVRAKLSTITATNRLREREREILLREKGGEMTHLIKMKVSMMVNRMRYTMMCPCSKRNRLKFSEATPLTPPTWVSVSDGGVHEEPVVKGDELEESETGTAQITKPGRVHISIQPPTDDGKYVCTTTQSSPIHRLDNPQSNPIHRLDTPLSCPIHRLTDCPKLNSSQAL